MSDGQVATRTTAHWRKFGKGGRPALLLHCSLAHAGSWRPLAERLGKRLNMVAMDLPGHGQSPPWDGKSEITSLAAEMAAELLPQDGQIDVVGHSFGAVVALLLACQHPQRIRTLTLIEPVLFAAAFADDPTCRVKCDEDFASFVEAWVRKDLISATREFTALWGDGSPWENVPEAQQQALAAKIHLIPAAHDALHIDCTGLLEGDRLARLPMPVSLIEGSQSHWVIGKIMHALSKRLPLAERAIIGRAGHMAPLTHSGAVAGILEQFLDAH